jgi:arylsulfatase A-like enzyme
MPNLFRLWQAGVKFDNYHTAANACTPARGTIISGLYSQQSWVLTTLVSHPSPAMPHLLKLEPVLNRHLPTYGKLLRAAGYSTPYCGKWHVSIPQIWEHGLRPYGFDFLSDPDPTGSNLQGTYGGTREGSNGTTQIYHSDAYTAGQAVEWLQANGAQPEPWCLTVGFVNPHDREFFPAGTEFKTVTDLFEGTQLKQIANYSASGPEVDWNVNKLKSPPSYGYPEVPPNWESSADWTARNKPSTQFFIKEFQQAVWGGVTDNPAANTPAAREVDAYPNPELDFGVAKMEFTYWRRGLDS